MIAQKVRNNNDAHNVFIGLLIWVFSSRSLFILVIFVSWASGRVMRLSPLFWKPMIECQTYFENIGFVYLFMMEALGMPPFFMSFWKPTSECRFIDR